MTSTHVVTSTLAVTSTPDVTSTPALTSIFTSLCDPVELTATQAQHTANLVASLNAQSVWELDFSLSDTAKGLIFLSRSNNEADNLFKISKFQLCYQVGLPAIVRVTQEKEQKKYNNLSPINKNRCIFITASLTHFKHVSLARPNVSCSKLYLFSLPNSTAS